MPVRSLGKGGSERRPLNNSLVDGLKEKRNDPSCQLAGGRAVDGAVVAPEDSPDAHVVVGLHHALEGRLKDSAVRRPTDEETVAHPRRVDRRNRRDADPVPPIATKQRSPRLLHPYTAVVAMHHDDSSRQTQRYPQRIILLSVSMSWT